MPQVAVMVNVYDLSEVNEYARPLGIGIFHSGLVVHGREFSFGGHDYASSGIFETAPKAAPAPAIFREEVYVGTTEMNPGEVSNLVGEMDDDFHGNTYHLLERNCNHFVEALCFELTGKMPPGFINRLARTAVVANSCAPCILPVSIRAVADTPSVPPPPSAATPSTQHTPATTLAASLIRVEEEEVDAFAREDVHVSDADALGTSLAPAPLTGSASDVPSRRCRSRSTWTPAATGFPTDMLPLPSTRATGVPSRVSLGDGRCARGG